MPRLVWHAANTKKYENGVRNVVLYVKNGTNGAYANGVAWNGVTAISEKPTGADTSAVYADDEKYLNIISNEDFTASIEALCYPDEFAECDGTKEIVSGFTATQQKRVPFALCYRTNVGDETDEEKGFKLHIIYGCLASPTEKGYTTMNDNKEPMNFSWEITTTPVEIGTGFRPTAHVEIDSTKYTETAAKARLDSLIDALYGSDSPSAQPTLKMPGEIKTILQASGS